MAAKSNSKEDVFQWIIKVSKSCNNPIQQMNVLPLIDTFDKIYNDTAMTTQLYTINIL